ncbi:flavodoxin family protein [Methanobacterium sp. ACI-7]|uniref:flavodoxin family protein n=1 Tax=unclassified Methanobacterium TaxID=2627676 RepID=UPI0039C4D196
MEIKRVLKLAGLALGAVLIASFALMGFVFFDGMSYTATGSEQLNPTGNVVGNALVVYDPGISGASKKVSEEIARNLQSKGYVVDLAGISSSKAKDESGYNIVVVGGPIYAGTASSSVKSYLNALKSDKKVKIAVFATGSDADVINNKDSLLKEVAPLPQNSSLKITAVTKVIDTNEANQKATEFVNALLK